MKGFVKLDILDINKEGNPPHGVFYFKKENVVSFFMMEKNPERKLCNVKLKEEQGYYLVEFSEFEKIMGFASANKKVAPKKPITKSKPKTTNKA